MNSLDDAFEIVQQERRIIEVHTKDATIFATIKAQFSTRNVDVVRRDPGNIPGSGFVLVRSADGDFRGAIGLEQMQSMLSPSSAQLVWNGPRRESSDSQIFDVFVNTTFTSFDRRQLLFTAREIEDRAYRICNGSLYTGFQRPEAAAAQSLVYDLLSDRDGLSVTVFLDDGQSITGFESAAVVTGQSTEFGQYWFVIYDDATNPAQTCGLLAEEVEPGSYNGFWTYDPSIVEEMVSYLQSFDAVR